MVAVIIGGSGSGKSEYAEDMAVGLNSDSMVYIATMESFDEESRTRIIRHQRQRRGKGFETMECYTCLEKMVISKSGTVLLECMSNLVANELFSETGGKVKTLEAVKKGIENLIAQCDNLIIVTNNVFEDGFLYDEETLGYMKVLAEINLWICSLADKVIEVIHAIPLVRSGKI